MRRKHVVLACSLALVAIPLAAAGQAKGPLKTALLSNLESITNRVNQMADDFPETKMNDKPTPQVRSFAEILLHIAGTNYYYIKTATSKDLGPDDPARSEYNSRAKVSRFLAESFQRLADQITSQSEADLSKNLATWIESLGHINEHYGNLVVYYRVNGIVPPSSRTQ